MNGLQHIEHIAMLLENDGIRAYDSEIIRKLRSMAQEELVLLTRLYQE